MNLYSWVQLIFYIVVLLALAKPLGSFMAKVYQGEHTFLDRVLGPVERFIYRVSGVKPDEDMNWKTYAIAVMVFNVLGLLVVYALQRLQAILPLNPQGLGAVTPDSSWNTAVSFATQYQLAGLRRRSDHELPLADARADGAELRLCGDRHGGFGRVDPRNCAAHRQRHRQLLGGSDPFHSLYPFALVIRCGSRACFTGRCANIQLSIKLLLCFNPQPMQTATL